MSRPSASRAGSIVSCQCRDIPNHQLSTHSHLMKTIAESRNRTLVYLRRLTLADVLLLSIIAAQTFAAPGDVDLSFDPGSSINGPVRAIAVLDDGKILIGGYFSTVHGAMCTGLARLNADGSLDTSFSANLTGPSLGVSAIAVQNDGKILVGGYLTAVNGIPRRNLARLNADGTLDESFLNNLAGPDSGVASMVLQSDGKVLIGGSFDSVNGVSRANLARLNSDGSFDSAFIAEPAAVVECIAVQADGGILIGGSFTAVNGIACEYVARLDPDGALETSFDAGLGELFGWVNCLVVQTNGQILIGGYLGYLNLSATVFRVNADGTSDAAFAIDIEPTFDPEPIMPTIALQPDGKILIGGAFDSINGVSGLNLVRLSPDGTIDETFSANLRDPLPYGSGWSVRRLVCQPDGRILYSSGPYSGSVRPGNSFGRLNTDGSMDPAFDIGPTGPDGEIYQAVAQPNGQILIAGQFVSVNGIPRGGIARLLSDGSLDGDFLDEMTGTDGSVFQIALQDDGRILVAGSFDSVNGVSRTNLARLNRDGSLDNTFLNGLGGPWGSYGGDVRAVGLQSDGRILIAGAFSSVNEVPRRNIARLNPDGSLDASFVASVTGNLDTILTLAFQPDGKILIGGYFNSVNGIDRIRLARLNIDGTVDTSFTANANGAVHCIAVQNDGRIIIGGWFSSINGAARKNIARLHPDGSIDASFNVPLPAMGHSVFSLFLPPDGKVLVGGGRLSTTPSLQHLARLDADGAFDPTFTGVSLNPSSVHCVTLQGDGKMLIAGSFSWANQIPRSYMARLLSDYLPPRVVVPPQSQTGEAGTCVYFEAEAEGHPPPVYQWFFNSTNAITDVTADRDLVITNVQAAQSGTYAVVITNAFGAITSAPVRLNVIPPVKRRPVPTLQLIDGAGGVFGMEYCDSLSPSVNWETLIATTLGDPPQFIIDLTEPLSPLRFYRAWQTTSPDIAPALDLHMVPAITLTGNAGDSRRLDYINAIGPIDAWETLDTVTLTNTSQLYFDTSSIDQPRRLYRIVPMP
jgi:uncharacterized delta-60 repeat protein